MVDSLTFVLCCYFCVGWTIQDSPNEPQLKELGDQMSADIFNVDGKRYTSQKSIQLYMTTGTASDWFYSDDANSNNKYRAAGYTYELRDTGQYGFLLPPNQVRSYHTNADNIEDVLMVFQIIPNGEELMPAVIRFAEELQAKPILNTHV